MGYFYILIGIGKNHYVSFMTLLGKTDGASAADGTGYPDIVAFINAYGTKLKAYFICEIPFFLTFL